MASKTRQRFRAAAATAFIVGAILYLGFVVWCAWGWTDTTKQGAWSKPQTSSEHLDRFSTFLIEFYWPEVLISALVIAVGICLWRRRHSSQSAVQNFTQLRESHAQSPMRVADLAYLEAHDSPTDYESPADFDHRQSMQEIRALGPHLSALVCHPLRLDDRVEDASYFAEWFVHEAEPRPCPGIPPGVTQLILSIRFSAFGRMYAIYSNTELCPLPDDLKERLIDFLASRNFVYVPDHLLEQPCASPIAPYWQIRFFDYL